jgi:hypothetical protein
MDTATLEFLRTAALVSAGIGLVLNWGGLVRSIRSPEVPANGPLIGVLLWAACGPLLVYCWIMGLPQKPLKIQGIVLSTIILLSMLGLVTTMGWREASPALANNGRIKAWAVFFGFLVISCAFLHNAKALT